MKQRLAQVMEELPKYKQLLREQPITIPDWKTELELLPTANHEFSDHHEPLRHKIKRTIWLPNYCPFRLRQITSQGKNHDTNYLLNIMRARGADVQYALLMHLHKMAGTIQRPPAARRYSRITKQGRARAVSMFAQRQTITRIAEELGCSKTSISNIVTDTPLRRHDMLSRDQMNRIYMLNKCGWTLSAIARELEKPISTIKYQLDKIKEGDNPRNKEDFFSLSLYEGHLTIRMVGAPQRTVASVRGVLPAPRARCSVGIDKALP